MGTTEGDGNQRLIAYDAEGNVLRTQDHHSDVAFEYRGMNRLAARTQASKRVDFLYDTEDQLLAIQNEHGLAYRFVLGPTGTVAEEWGFDQLRRRFMRDASGRVTTVVRLEGKSTSYVHDAAGRITGVEHSDGVKEAFAYRPDGVMLNAKNEQFVVAFERDPLGRVSREMIGEDWVACEYDALGRRKASRSSKGHFQKITRNARGHVVAVDVEAARFSASFSRDRLGLELERQLPGGVRGRWERDSLGRPVRVRAPLG